MRERAREGEREKERVRARERESESERVRKSTREGGRKRERERDLCFFCPGEREREIQVFSIRVNAGKHRKCGQGHTYFLLSAKTRESIEKA